MKLLGWRLLDGDIAHSNIDHTFHVSYSRSGPGWGGGGGLVAGGGGSVITAKPKQLMRKSGLVHGPIACPLLL